jgi:hypothetical protein
VPILNERGRSSRMVHAVSISALAKSVAIMFAAAMVVYRMNNRPDPFADEIDDGTSGIDHAALHAAENAAAETIDQQRSRLLPEMKLWSRIPTSSMSEVQIADFLDAVSNENIEVAVLFDADLSPRAARALRQMGCYEVYVHEKDRVRLEEFEKRS